ncbi:MAG: ATP synthase F1 subunit delta [Candidatus Raymondbacteria bacterium RifOxyA12_full_50_37]|uniref:ATP synthase subunit delta n=1 Tax=Candidatus Raymondbacteria bacterium RIFOXYD12_FULL_49_13 TaxID=1817890 RepID=A0A1F7F5Q6_UNCRA|nr:MAG: ATP synthase F1 subunit delta [Candidatus Raymondbacteria bacterium RifOxyA12_full_50_37]OGJ89237.1 MAG: ATP synthase F1 subunit delta [Candidatus Raymondbacteria bacterium RIFOXYA2_FULL_49_16]OGJ97403.1 MAG: ATP synthase F1 subunit delta [Candidatus Raymondbacteria bacterium RIFOXYC2_FULL_50_21]OGJ99873.1 MAG: ATP synthase F1 subunit delta [Candidatus Raymondbacteria bacterium RifOxyB12_full_50_8]OGK01918.1 MAG: ATP synthase F1 subunit delta [Candidatus Raymondbacteria bacterium RIFOXY
MSEWVVAKRYATAFFQLALEQKVRDQAVRDIQSIYDCCRGSVELRQALANPVIPHAVKRNVVSELFAGSLSPLTDSFIRFLGYRDRINILPLICEKFIVIEKEERGFVNAKLFTAKAVPADLIGMLVKGLNRKFGKSFEIEANVEPELQGGFKLWIQDKIYDCSIQNQLERLKQKMVG